MRLNFSNFADCLGKIAARGRITNDEAKQILQETADRAEKMRQTGESDPFIAAARELAAQITDGARLNKTDALRNAGIRAGIMKRIDDKGGVASAAETLRSVLHGTHKTGLDSVQSHSRGLASDWQGVLSWKIRSLGAEKAVISGAMDKDIATELWRINAGAGEGSGNELARSVAEAIHPVLNQVKNRLNTAGARIATAVDYVAHTSHDPYRLRAAAGSSKASPDEAFKAWWADTQPKLASRTFDGVTSREGETEGAAHDRFGRSVWEALVTGVHMTPEGAFGFQADEKGFVLPAFEGTRNIARKVSQPRTLFWKDGAAWNDYAQKYSGNTSLTQGVMRSITGGAKKIALMERMGTNPAANLNQIIRGVEEKYRPDVDAIRKFQGKVNGVKNVMAYMDGSTNIPANNLAATIGQNARTITAMSDLGGVGLTHFASIWPTVSSELRHHGVGRLEALGNMMGRLMAGKGSAERQAIMSDLGAYADGLSRDMNGNWQPDTPLPGKLSSLANTFMKYTGIHYVFDNTQAAVRSMLSHNLARNLDKDFGGLAPHLQQMLSSYGIKEPEWKQIRAVTELRTENGRAYLTPKDVLPLENGASLADKLNGYFSDVAAHSTVTAGARERALLLGGTRPGSLWGEASRYMTQFKMWPVAAMDQLIRREIYMSTSKAGQAWSIGTMVALSAAAGYMRMAINDVASGRPVRDPRDWKTALAAAAQGGGLGIIGDFLFGEVSRMGGGLVATLGGPVTGDIDSFVKLYGRFVKDLTNPEPSSKGRFHDLWPDLAHFAVRHIPFANLVYLKGTLDYLLWYHLYEAASPGWWDRTNRRLQKEQGRTMQGYAPGAGIPYTPFGVGAH